jgi:hypothetical protein
VIAVWYSSLESEIMAMSGAILNADEIPPTPWPVSSPILRNVTETVSEASLTQPPVVETVQPSPAPIASNFPQTSAPAPLNSVEMIYLGALPSMVALAVFFVAWKWKHRQ